MSFWKGWSRGNDADPREKQESELDAIKRIARENAFRERVALEAKPRLGASEIAAHVSRIRTIDDVRRVYSGLKGVDFCDIVSGAVKSGNLSDSDASFALYFREWVRTDAHLRTSFPEWMEAEGRAHFLLLNRQWLESGVDPNTTFEEWLSSIEPPVRPELSTAQSPAAPTDPVWGPVASAFDRNNVPMMDGLLKQVYESVYRLRDHPRLMAYHASFVCGVAVAIRIMTGTDMATLKSPIASPTLSQLTKKLDDATLEHLKFLSTSAKDDPRRLDVLNKMHALLLWRGYLLGLSTTPSAWGPQAISAFSSLKMMMTADPAFVTSSLREDKHGMTTKVFDESTRNNVNDADWPPSGYIDLFFKNHALLEQKCRSLFGTFD